MQIAVASGKGGTGKTTIASNLACVISENGTKVRYADCDVEEPNGHLFFHPSIEKHRNVSIPVPEVDASRCTGCGLCAEICQYKVIASFAKKILVFAELCHGCGGCIEVCPENALTETGRAVGVVESGMASMIHFIHGNLRIGEAMSPPLIRAVRQEIKNDAINIIDVPPGTSCPVITAIKDVDYVVLVTEPTPFGLHDLSLALDMVRELELPHGVVVNRHEDSNLRARMFCKEHNVPVLAEIPDDRRVAEAYSIGTMIAKEVPGFDTYFQNLWVNIQEHIHTESVA